MKTPEIITGQDQTQLPRLAIGSEREMREYGRQIGRAAIEKVRRERAKDERDAA